MKTREYPELGSLVNYLRADENGKIFDGVGSVQAIFLDPRNRLMVRVKDGEHDYNVDYIGVNWNEDVRSAYEDAITRVAGVTIEGNELVKSTVQAYNGKVEAIYNELMGEPVIVESGSELEETEH